MTHLMLQHFLLQPLASKQIYDEKFHKIPHFKEMIFMFCSNCGSQLAANAQFCTNCGASNGVKTVAQPPVAQPNTAYIAPASPHGQYAGHMHNTAPPSYEGSFTQHLHSFGSSNNFLVGIVLFSAGSLFSLLFSLGIMGIFSLAMLALPVVGMWLIYAASKRPSLPEKTFTALTLFKVHTIIGIVFLSIAILVVVLVTVLLVFWAIEDGLLFNEAFIIPLIVGGLIGIGFVVLFMVLYYVSLLKILKGIGDNMRSNSFAPIRGVTPFTVIAWIGIVFGVLGALSMLAGAGWLEESYDIIFRDLSNELAEFTWILNSLESFWPSTRGLMASAIFTLASNIGTAILLVMLSKFNGGLKQRY